MIRPPTVSPQALAERRRARWRLRIRAVLILGALFGLSLLTLSLCAPQPSRPPSHPAEAPRGEAVPIRTVRVVDGDTLEIGAERVRLQGIDAPETGSAHCAAERQAGLAATAEAARLVRDGREARLTRGEPARDRYGRTLGDVAIDGVDLGRYLLERGLALPWRPGSAAKAERIAHWCGAGDW